MNMPQIFKTKYMVNSENIEAEKKFRFGGEKMAKSNKIEKTEELIARHQEAECVLSVVQRQKLTANGLNNLRKQFDMLARRFYYLSVIYKIL